MGFETEILFIAKSERVKGIDIHPTRPWILTTLHTGQIYIWSLETQQIIKTFQDGGRPVRAGKFIAQKNWIACGDDGGVIRVYDVETTDKVVEFNAHNEFVRAIVVHPKNTLILTTSDDKSVKCWDWEKEWKCMQVFEGHGKYVMGVAFDPNDPEIFASASLDGSVKIWSTNSSAPTATLDAHVKGVNSIAYYPPPNHHQIITTSDDRTIKIWDVTARAVVAVLEGHSSNLTFAVHHPRLSLIISGAEDGSVRFWDSATYTLEKSVDCRLGRAWCMAFLEDGACIGFDDGFAMLKIRDEQEMLL